MKALQKEGWNNNNSTSSSLQHRGILFDRLVIIRLESKPHLTRIPTLLMRTSPPPSSQYTPSPIPGRPPHSPSPAHDSTYQRQRTKTPPHPPFPAGIHAVVLRYHTAHRRAQRFGDPDAFFGGDDGAAVAGVALRSVPDAEALHFNPMAPRSPS